MKIDLLKVYTSPLPKTRYGQKC